MYPSPTHQYNVYIESGFTPEHCQSVINAFLEWQVNTDETVKFVQVWTPDHSQPLIIVKPSTWPKMSRIFDVPLKEGLVGETHEHYASHSSEIWLAEDQNSVDFHEVALHEFGHALGLKHDKNTHDKTIMRAHTPDSSDFLTCKDLQAFCALWSCDANKFPLCMIRHH